MGAMPTRRIASLVVVAGLVACASLTPQQDAGWTAFQGCRVGAHTAVLEELFVTGRVGYFTREGGDFSLMKVCMEQHGYACDLEAGLSSAPITHCYPRTSAR
jgi:Flp pilus assembly protein protease CpaA